MKQRRSRRRLTGSVNRNELDQAQCFSNALTSSSLLPAVSLPCFADFSSHLAASSRFFSTPSPRKYLIPTSYWAESDPASARRRSDSIVFFQQFSLLGVGLGLHGCWGRDGGTGPSCHCGRSHVGSGRRSRKRSWSWWWLRRHGARR